MNPFLLTDGYKTGHHEMYPKGTSLVFSNFTPRSNKHAPEGCDEVVVFGTQMVVQQIHDIFYSHFFSKPKEQVINEVEAEYSMYLGMDYDASHIAELHDLGFLPIFVKGVPEGSTVKMGVPVLTIYNTDPKFYWITNFLETLISNLLWKPMTSATIAHEYKKRLSWWANKTDKENMAFVDFQGHDFSMRGLDSIHATISSGLGHALSFLGSDSLPVIHGARRFYNTPAHDPVVHSVPATEHSVMCAGTKGDEIGTFRSLMEKFPKGILSVVSDTWDLWKVCTEYLPELKEEILARDGKLVIRPDSGNPVDILCGKPRKMSMKGEAFDAECKGVIKLLWDVFGGTINKQGYKCLDPHIGAIYGDSITLDRAEEICRRLEANGFASTNVVLGIGSFTYQFNTRDTFGFAMKATYVEVDGEGREIFKDPVTDDGTKKSAKGLIATEHDGDSYVLKDQATWQEVMTDHSITYYADGVAFQNTPFRVLRQVLDLKVKSHIFEQNEEYATEE